VCVSVCVFLLVTFPTSKKKGRLRTWQADLGGSIECLGHLALYSKDSIPFKKTFKKRA